MLSRQLPCRPSVARCPGPARPGERASRELAALAGVPDVGQHVTGERFLQCVNGMHGFPRDGAPMREYLLAQSTAAGRYTNPLAIGMYAVSSAHAWLARSIFRQRSRYGQLLCCALRRLVFRLAIQRLHAHALHQRAHATAPHFTAFPAQQARKHPCVGKRKLHVRFVDAAHRQLFCLADRLRSGNTCSISRCQPAASVAKPAAYAYGRSSLYAQQSRLGERAA